jgi:hypothetical protein
MAGGGGGDSINPSIGVYSDHAVFGPIVALFRQKYATCPFCGGWGLVGSIVARKHAIVFGTWARVTLQRKRLHSRLPHCRMSFLHGVLKSAICSEMCTAGLEENRRVEYHFMLELSVSLGQTKLIYCFTDPAGQLFTRCNYKIKMGVVN